MSSRDRLTVRRSLIGLTSLLLAAMMLPAAAQTPEQINAALSATHAKYNDLKEGANADYIPAPAKVDSNI